MGGGVMKKKMEEKLQKKLPWRKKLCEADNEGKYSKIAQIGDIYFILISFIV